MTAVKDAPPTLPGYEYIELLGSGGFADVYLYEQQMPRRRVAVKVLRGEGLSDDLRRQFTGEANVMAALSSHPYIVTIFGADATPDGRLYLVMEYYSGPNMSVRSRTKPLGVAEAVRIGVQLAGAVETAHRGGVLHRDLKPANVLTSAFGKPGLTDFGISAVVGETAGDGGGLSIPWSPPELFDDAAIADERSDVYSLAATIYSLLTGRSPFESATAGNSAIELMSRIERQPLPSLGRSDAPGSLERCLAAAMAKAPDARPPSAASLARMLQGVEREMRLQPTELDIPDEVEHTSPPAASPSGAPVTSDDGEGTRRRSPVVVSPEGSAGTRVSPAPAGPPSTTAPPRAAAAGSDATALRPRTVAAQGGDATRMRPATVTSDRAPEPAKKAGSSRRWVFIAAAVGVAAVVGAGAATALSGGDEPKANQPSSNDVSVDLNELDPVKPTNVQVQRVGQSEFQVSWTPGQGASASEQYILTVRGQPVPVTTNPGEVTRVVTIEGVDYAVTPCVTLQASLPGRQSSAVASGPGCTG